MNGAPHFTNGQAHLFVGQADVDKRAWVLDECLDAGYATGAIYLPLREACDATLPLGTQTWLRYDDAKGAAVQSSLTLSLVPQS